MKAWQIIKAPLSVQLNRSVFAFYAAFPVWPLWKFRHTASPEGWIIFSSFLFFSLLGFFYSCVPAPRSRWIMSVIIVLIPAIVLALMFQMKIFSRPQTWWEWPLDLLPLFLWFGIPTLFACLLFKDKRAKEYFTGSALK